MAKAKPFKAARADGKARTVLVSCRFIPEGAQVVTKLAAKMGISRAEFMRRAIRYYAEKAGYGK